MLNIFKQGYKIITNFKIKIENTEIYKKINTYIKLYEDPCFFLHKTPCLCFLYKQYMMPIFGKSYNEQYQIKIAESLYLSGSC